MKLRSIIKGLQRTILSKSSSAKRIVYLRQLGVRIGENCTIETMSFSTEPYLVEIGDNVGIAGGTDFIAHDGGIRCFRDEFPEDDIFGKIEVGNNVFIGSNCTILPNTIIGNNSIVGAGSVVRGHFPDNSVILGNPAKIIGDMRMQRFLYRRSPGRMATSNMSDQRKRPLVVEHFKNLINKE